MVIGTHGRMSVASIADKQAMMELVLAGSGNQAGRFLREQRETFDQWALQDPFGVSIEY